MGVFANLIAFTVLTILGCTQAQDTNTTAAAVQYCSDPPTIDGASIEGNYPGRRFAQGHSVSYVCKTGYRFKGEIDAIYCLSSGRYSTPLPICQRINCSEPVRMANSNVTFGATTFGSVAKYSCDKGYTFNRYYSRLNTYSVRCLSTGAWSQPPSCRPKNCYRPQHTLFGNVVYTSTLYLSSAYYSCRLGYKLNGSAIVNCTENGWSPPPKCITITCTNPPNVTNAMTDKNGPVKHGATVKYKCATGYVMEGHDYVTCQSDGSWSNSPSCRVIDCRTAPNIHHGVYSGNTSTRHGSTVIYSCDSGYTLIGVPIVTCLDNGQWSTIPSCEKPSDVLRVESANLVAAANSTALSGLAVTCAVLILLILGGVIYFSYRKGVVQSSHKNSEDTNTIM